jgi:hypothetical protein
MAALKIGIVLEGVFLAAICLAAICLAAICKEIPEEIPEKIF